MRRYILEENNWKNVSTEDYRVAILPWGATEAHNFHLPYGTDTSLAVHVAAEAARHAWGQGVRCVVLPAQAYGVNSGQMEVKLCMNMHPSTQLIVLDNIIEVLLKAGLRRLVILNAHGGNQFQPLIRELSVKYPQMLMACCNWWHAAKAGDYFQEPGDHAGELETACMQAIAPDLVLPLTEAGTGEERRFKIQGLREKWAWTPRRWVLITQDTGVGNPAAAKPENGARFLKDCATRIGNFLCDFAAAEKEEDLYE